MRFGIAFCIACSWLYPSKGYGGFADWPVATRCPEFRSPIDYALHFRRQYGDRIKLATL